MCSSYLFTLVFTGLDLTHDVTVTDKNVTVTLLDQLEQLTSRDTSVT